MKARRKHATICTTWPEDWDGGCSKLACHSPSPGAGAEIPHAFRESASKPRRTPGAILRSLTRNVAHYSRNYDRLRVAPHSALPVKSCERVTECGSAATKGECPPRSAAQLLRHHPSSLFFSGSNLYGDKCSVAGALGPYYPKTTMDEQKPLYQSHSSESFRNMTIWEWIEIP